MNIRFAQKSGVEKRDLEGGIVLVKTDESQYFGLNRVGACIWESIEQPCSLEQLAVVVSLKFEVETDECRETILDFLKQLKQQDLVTEL